MFAIHTGVKPSFFAKASAQSCVQHNTIAFEIIPVPFRVPVRLDSFNQSVAQLYAMASVHPMAYVL